MLINCDLGERGINDIDDEIIKYVDIINLACGGHAGDPETIKHYKNRAVEYNVEISAHLSYPDKENFGRTSMQLTRAELFNTLSEQYALLSDITMVKLHGALYNDCWYNRELAENVVDWFVENRIKKVIAPYESRLVDFCLPNNIEVLYEAFAERRYTLKDRQICLVPRSERFAEIKNVKEALLQVKQFEKGIVTVLNSPVKFAKVQVDTACVHSDSIIALELVKALSEK